MMFNWIHILGLFFLVSFQQWGWSSDSELSIGEGSQARNICLYRKGQNTVFCYGNNEYGQAIRSKMFNQIRSVHVGPENVCVIDADGVWCYGRNDRRQLSVPYLTKNVRSITINNYHLCALDEEGVKCWGYPSSRPIIVPKGLKNVREIVSTGNGFTCALDENGVKCWGGFDESIQRVPNDLKNVRSIVAGHSHACALTSKGVKCWGIENRPDLRVPEGLGNVRSLFAGSEYTCALRRIGLKCWGSGAKNSFDTAVLDKVKSISAGAGYLCGIDGDIVKCTGSGGFYDGRQMNVPIQLGNVTEIWSKYHTTCAQSDKGLNCWGQKKHSKVYSVPKNLMHVKSLGIGIDIVCAIDQENTKCWGDKKRRFKDLPSGRTDIKAVGFLYRSVLFSDGLSVARGGNRYDVKYVFSNSEGTSAIYANDYLFCAVKEKSLFCNGLSSKVTDQIPSSIPDIKSVVAARFGDGEFACVLLNGGNVQCWQNNSDESINQMNDLKGVRMIAAGSQFACALDADGVKCFGNNDFGQTIVPKDLKNVRSISAGDDFACALDDDGVKCWGMGRFEVPSDF